MSVLHDVNMPKASGAGKLPENAGYQEKDLVEEALKWQKQKALLDSLSGGKREGDSESIAAAIVKSAMDVNLKTNEQLQKQLHDRQIDVDTARKREDDAKEELYKVIAGQIGGALERIEKVKEDWENSHSKRTEKSLVEQIKEAQEVITLLKPEVPAQPMQNGPSDTVVNFQMEQLKSDHELNMQRMKMELEKMQNEMKLHMEELKESRYWKEKEWEESSNFRRTALSQITDLAASVAAGFGGGQLAQEGISSQQEPMKQNPAKPSKEPHKDIGPVINSFQCEHCGAEIVIPEEGDTVMCPTPRCEAVYGINRTEQPE
ncbi:MAG: hypothetical protein M0R06_16080 [Sphaerochaeta sp.]|jgi:hypothetical protein|nr:hypothetical protein [Sphaerochaeta sp.]